LSEERAFWLAWSQIPGVGSVLLRRIDLHFGGLSRAWKATPDELTEVDGIGPQTAAAIATHRSKLHPVQRLEDHEKTNRCFLTPADSDYPRLLLEIPDPPSVLYYRGHLSVLRDLDRGHAIAVVGTREPSDYGRRWTRKLSSTLAHQGFIILSGLADGIDAEAHRSCLEANGKTVAVLGTGVDVVYPWTNRRLYSQLLETGLVLSEYPAGTQPDRTHFPRRNRIVAGLSRAVLVIEAPDRSGALITANLANDYGRDVYALPGSLDNPKSYGCLELINKGAHLILSDKELLKTLGTLPRLDQANHVQTQLPLLDLAPELSQVLQAITTIAQEASHPSVPFDLIVQHTQLPTAAVTGSLLQLEVMGVITQVPGMRYQLC
jgi:DNA processing protein